MVARLCGLAEDSQAGRRGRRVGPRDHVLHGGTELRRTEVPDRESRTIGWLHGQVLHHHKDGAFVLDGLDVGYEVSVANHEDYPSCR